MTKRQVKYTMRGNLIVMFVTAVCFLFLLFPLLSFLSRKYWLVLLHYYKNSPPMSKSWIRAWSDISIAVCIETKGLTCLHRYWKHGRANFGFQNCSFYGTKLFISKLFTSNVFSFCHIIKILQGFTELPGKFRLIFIFLPCHHNERSLETLK